MGALGAVVGLDGPSGRRPRSRARPATPRARPRRTPPGRLRRAARQVPSPGATSRGGGARGWRPCTRGSAGRGGRRAGGASGRGRDAGGRGARARRSGAPGPPRPGPGRDARRAPSGRAAERPRTGRRRAPRARPGSSRGRGPRPRRRRGPPARRGVSARRARPARPRYRPSRTALPTTRATLSSWRRSFSRGGGREPLSCRALLAPLSSRYLSAKPQRLRSGCGRSRVQAADGNPRRLRDEAVRGLDGCRQGDEDDARLHASVPQETASSSRQACARSSASPLSTCEDC